MNLETINSSNAAQFQLSKASDQVSEARKKAEEGPQSEQIGKKQLQPEELINQIKALTEDGVYSVRFENDHEVGELVVKVVNPETDEVIRQIPPEELIELTQRLNDLRGNIVDTQS